jgi:hypothetical protein
LNLFNNASGGTEIDAYPCYSRSGDGTACGFQLFSHCPPGLLKALLAVEAWRGGELHGEAFPAGVRLKAADPKQPGAKPIAF